MDQKRWVIVCAVACLMIVTLVLLSRSSRPRLQNGDETSLEAVSDDDRIEKSALPSSAGGSGVSQHAEPGSSIVVPPPPAFFAVLSAPEEDARMTQGLAARGKALKPDVFVASPSGNASRVPVAEK